MTGNKSNDENKGCKWMIATPRGKKVAKIELTFYEDLTEKNKAEIYVALDDTIELLRKKYNGGAS